MLALIAASLLVQATASISSAPARQVEDRPVSRALAERAIPAPREPGWIPGQPPFAFRPTRARYNRIEGLSLAAVGGMQLRNRDVLGALVRFGTADLVPEVELELSRERRMRELSVTAYHRLVAANSWGNPLAFGASLGAFLIGRDEGFYYRTGGAELRWIDSTRDNFDMRVFAERHRSALVKNDFSVADVFGDRDFHANIAAREGDIAGLEVNFLMRRGQDTVGFRFLGEARLEAAVGDFDYSRLMFEVVVANPLLPVVLGSLTLSAGTSGGELPAQRSWYLGGQRSLRGQRAGVMSGSAFWMTQLEAGPPNVYARPVVFFDAGWAGSRQHWSSPGRIGTGAGVGVSFFEGALRFDVARGLYPGTGLRGGVYINARF